jgi:hydrogenase maturation protein HypF
LNIPAKFPSDFSLPKNGVAREGLRLLVRGQVQGVGFRPFVYRLARQCRLGGRVFNATAGVAIEVEGSAADLADFRQLLLDTAPAAAQIDGLTVEPVPPAGRTSFAIEASEPLAAPVVRVPRDLATCNDCRRELLDPADRRHGYPFTNCTICGPRYSIVTGMPYDRPVTVMHQFHMCDKCHAEYHCPDDRRFHAQPNACGACGPQVALWDTQSRTVAGPDTAIAAAIAMLREGQIVAVKGLGGFQLLVRADLPEAVTRLRQRKHRPGKPLAVMVPDMVGRARLTPAEERLLRSPGNPILLIDRKALDGGDGWLAPQVAPRVSTVGLFLPTTPLHHLLLAGLGMPVVATSGNRSEEPIVTDEHDAARRLGGIADAFLVHNRPIVRRVDDSVAGVFAGRPVMFRLARGYAPLPLPALEDFARTHSLPPLLATGGHQKTAIAAWTGTQAVLAQHIGDMDHPDTRAALDDVAIDLLGLYRCEPSLLACDLHPDYYPTQWAQQRRKAVAQVQHHHAHAVSCMAEHGLLDREVLAFTWDGTGYGPDGTVWGGEVLRARHDGFARIASLLPFPLPGGEAAVRHPPRAAFGMLWVLFGEELVKQEGLLARLGLTAREASLMAAMIRRGLNTPWTSSAGRLFDAVAALLLDARAASYEGEAAIWLEAVADPTVCETYELPLLASAEASVGAGDPSVPRGDWRPMLSAILDELRRGTSPDVLAARFHNTLAGWAAAIARTEPFGDVVLSGGCFQNRLLAERTAEAVQAAGRRVHLHGFVPPGDGGLAAGQLAIAMASCRTACPSVRV